MRSVVWFGLVLLVGAGWWLLGGDDEPPRETTYRDASVPEEGTPPELRVADGPTEPRVDVPRTEPTPIEIPDGLTKPKAKHGRYTIQGRLEMADPSQRIPAGDLLGDAAHTYFANARQHAEGKVWRTTPDRAGRFTLAIEGAPPYPVTRFTFEGPHARVRNWKVERASPDRGLDTTDGAVNQIVITLGATFRLKGTVHTSRGKPVAGAAISWGTLHSHGQGSMTLTMERAKTDAEGRFDVGPFDLDPSLITKTTKPFMKLSVDVPGHALVRVDPWTVSAEERDRVEVVIDEGAVLEGVLLDPDGQPLPGVVVALEYGEDWKRRKATRTDERGLWRLEQVSRGKTRIQALAAAHACKVDQAYDVGDGDHQLELVATPLPMPGPIRRVAGWGFAEVNDAQRKAWMLPDDVKVVILEVPEDHARFGIGVVEPGNGLWIVGDDAVTSIEDAVTRLLAMTAPKGAAHRRSIPPARIVYTFRAERMRGTNTQHIRLTSQDRAALEALAATLEER